MSEDASKRKVLAAEKERSLLNKSVSKAQYSFSRSQRFPQRSFSLTSHIQFYDLPKKKESNISFGSSQRSLLLNKMEGPPPGTYFSKQNKSTKDLGITFKAGRDKCTNNSPFVTTDNPGPANYHPNDPKYKSLQYSLGKRCHTQKEQPISNALYNFDSTLLDRNKYLSIYVRRSAAKMFPPSSNPTRRRLKQSRRADEKRMSEKECESRLITKKGGKQLGQNSPNVVIPKSKRKTIQTQENGPGPGQYRSFSEFIDNPEL